MASHSDSIKQNEPLKHGWTSDSIEDLGENIDQMIGLYKSLNLGQLYSKCQEELKCWHAAAVAHLGQVYAQRLSDLSQVYCQEVRPESEKFQEKMCEQLKKRILPRINQVLDDPSPDPAKVEKMQVRRSCSDVLSNEKDREDLRSI